MHHSTRKAPQIDSYDATGLSVGMCVESQGLFTSCSVQVSSESCDAGTGASTAAESLLLF